MSTPSASFDDLINRFVADNLQPEEVEQFFAFLKDEEFRERYGNRVEQDLLKEAWLGWKNEQQSDRLYQQILQAGGISYEQAPAVVHRTHFIKTAWFRYAAAIVLLASATTAFFLLKPAETPAKQVAEERPAPETILMPGSNKAMLTLSNGQKVELGKTGGNVIQDGVISIKNDEGQLIYANNTAAGQNAFNTIATPNGGMFQLLLSDGTKVWLNAASSITYPVVFNTARREVSITGEAYFEVKQQKDKPFVVKTPAEEILVLGTAFNVNSYADEPGSKTSLLEGAVKINNTILKPGQAWLGGKVTGTDIRQDIAWKTGYFDFNKLPCDQALRQLARWYDVSIVYENGIPREGLGGRMERNLTLNDALGGLDGIVATFRLEGKTVYVTALPK